MKERRRLMPAISVIVPVYQAEALLCGAYRWGRSRRLRYPMRPRRRLPRSMSHISGPSAGNLEKRGHLRLGAAADRRWQPGRFSDPVRRLRRKRPPHSRVPQAQRRRVHRPESGVRAGHGTVYRLFGFPDSGTGACPSQRGGAHWRNIPSETARPPDRPPQR